MDRKCSPCDIATALGVTQNICKKIKDKKSCRNIFDPLFDRDEPPSKTETKKVVRKIKKMTKSKKHKEALDEVIRFLG